MKRQTVDSIPIRSHITEVFVEPSLAVVENEWNMIMKRSGDF